jgi:hypothetical protein
VYYLSIVLENVRSFLYQGSEPLSANQSDFNRTRDTRSVEPAGYPDKFQGKPPSGRRSSTKDSLLKNMKLELLPPRLQKKYLIDNGYTLPSGNSGTFTEDSWNGSSVTFQVKVRSAFVDFLILHVRFFVYRNERLTKLPIDIIRRVRPLTIIQRQPCSIRIHCRI